MGFLDKQKLCGAYHQWTKITRKKNSLQDRERSHGTKSHYPFEHYGIRTTGIYAATFKPGLCQLHSIGPSYPTLFICAVVGGSIFFNGQSWRGRKILQLLCCKTQHAGFFEIHKRKTRSCSHLA